MDIRAQFKIQVRLRLFMVDRDLSRNDDFPPNYHRFVRHLDCNPRRHVTVVKCIVNFRGSEPTATPGDY